MTELVDTIAGLRERLDAERAAGRRIGFVPTMGYLHDGHTSLVDAAVANDDVTVVSIFVNPLQFAEGEDLADYPRDLDADLARCRRAGAELVFAPSVEEMYPRPVDDGGRPSPPCRGPPRRGCTRPEPFRRRGHGGRQALLDRGAVPGLLRRAKDWQQVAVVTAYGGRSLDSLSRSSPCPTRAGARRSRDVEPQHLPQPRRSGPRPRSCVGPSTRVLARVEAGETDPAVVEAAMRRRASPRRTLGSVDYVGGGAGRHARRRRSAPR